MLLLSEQLLKNWISSIHHYEKKIGNICIYTFWLVGRYALNQIIIGWTISGVIFIRKKALLNLAAPLTCPSSSSLQICVSDSFILSGCLRTDSSSLFNQNYDEGSTSSHSVTCVASTHCSPCQKLCLPLIINETTGCVCVESVRSTVGLMD